MNKEQEKEVEKFSQLIDNLLADKRFNSAQLVEIFEAACSKLELWVDNLQQEEQD